MTKMTREEYDALEPRSKGVACYWLSAHNPNIPSTCPYEKGTREYDDFQAGQFAAVLFAQDSED